jgi:hypothetical protein
MVVILVVHEGEEKWIDGINILAAPGVCQPASTM